MKSDVGLGMRVFSRVIRVFAFASLYLTVMTACGMTAARWIALFPALGIVVPLLVFSGKKWLKIGFFVAAVLYSLACIAIGFSDFIDGANIFGDLVAATVNGSRHAGWEYSGVAYSMSADFLFTSVIAVWIGIVALVACKRGGILFAALSIVVTLVLMMIGLLPKYYCIVPLVVTWIGLLVVDRGFMLKSAWSYVAVMAAVCIAFGVCMVYSGSASVKAFRADIADMTESILYGSDTLPQGVIKNAGGLHGDDELRLKVTMSSRTPKLYLKGFVGSDLSGNVWQPTDRNVYVEQEYRGLIDYLDEGGLPFMQYAKYSALCGNANKYSVSITNVEANGKYMYVPYGLSGYSSGSPYYDLNIRNGAWASKTYGYSVFTGDGSSEWTTQDKWLFDPSVRTVAMNNYLALENEYRAFVYDNYCAIDDDTKNMIREQLYGIPTDSINTAARLLRTYFEEHYYLSDTPDKTGSNFISDFFGGKIKHANSVYYATAATYAFRAFGFAARYVEGYLAEVDPEKSGVQTIAVTSKNAHAWTEVYFDGIGWLPIEVTFEVQDPNVPVDPDDPGTENPPEIEDPDPPDDPTPVTPDDPDIKPGNKENGGLNRSEMRLVTALEVLLPILGIALGCVLVVLAVVVRRNVIIGKKRKKLEVKNSDFGRAAFGIVERDCRSIGGFDVKKLAEYGVDETSSKRFMQLIEKSVYGECELNANERKIVIRYIDSVAAAVSNSGNKTNKFLCKYIKCLGL